MVYTDFCVTIKPDLESIDSIRETVMAEYIGPESRFSGEHYPHQYTTRTEDNHFYFGRRDQHGRPVDWGETLREDGMGDGIIAVVFAVETDHIGYGQLHQYDDQTGTYEPVPEIAEPWTWGDLRRRAREIRHRCRRSIFTSAGFRTSILPVWHIPTVG